MSEQAPATRIVLGRICGVHGVRGWVKIFSDTDPREGILGYRHWLLGDDPKPRRVRDGQRHGKSVIAQLEGCEDRDQAAALVGCDIAVTRDQLPPPSPDEFYWCDLEHLEVVTREGVSLGQVDHLFATGANDVLVVKGERERLLPFVWEQVVLDVDFTRKRIDVDWDPEF